MAASEFTRQERAAQTAPQTGNQLNTPTATDQAQNHASADTTGATPASSNDASLQASGGLMVATLSHGERPSRSNLPLLDRRVIVGSPALRSVSAVWGAHDEPGKAFAVEIVSELHPRNVFGGYAARVLECDTLAPGDFGMVEGPGMDFRFVLVSENGWYFDLIDRKDLDPAGMQVLGVVTAEKEYRTDTQIVRQQRALWADTSEVEITAAMFNRGLDLVTHDSQRDIDVSSREIEMLMAHPRYQTAARCHALNLEDAKQENDPEAAKFYLASLAAEMFRAGVVSQIESGPAGLLHRSADVVAGSPPDLSEAS